MTIREALEKANRQLMSKIDNAMSKEVFEEVQDEESATIYSEVYKVYTPRMYAGVVSMADWEIPITLKCRVALLKMECWLL